MPPSPVSARFIYVVTSDRWGLSYWCWVTHDTFKSIDRQQTGQIFLCGFMHTDDAGWRHHSCPVNEFNHQWPKHQISSLGPKNQKIELSQFISISPCDLISTGPELNQPLVDSFGPDRVKPTSARTFALHSIHWSDLWTKSVSHSFTLQQLYYGTELLESFTPIHTLPFTTFDPTRSLPFPPFTDR